MPEDFDLKGTSKMGLTLVRTLCAQLKAEMNVTHKDGFVSKITFTKKDSKGSSSGLV